MSSHDDHRQPDEAPAVGIGRGAAVFVTIVLVLGIGVGAYFVLFDRNPTRPGNRPRELTQQTTTTAPKPGDALAIADLPGHVEDPGPITTFAEAQQKAKFLTPEEAKFLTDAGAGKAHLLVTATDEGLHPMVVTMQTSSPQAAAAARDKLAAQQLGYGLVKINGTPPGVLAARRAGNDTSPDLLRAHYTHGSTVVRIQITGNDLTLVGELFDDVIKAQLAVLPAAG